MSLWSAPWLLKIVIHTSLCFPDVLILACVVSRLKAVETERERVRKEGLILLSQSLLLLTKGKEDCHFRVAVSCCSLAFCQALAGAGQKTPEIFVLASSNKKWRHIRFKLRFAARFTKRENGFDYSRFPSICKPSVSFHFILSMEGCCRHITSTF